MKENEKKVKEKKKRGQPEGFPRSILTRPVWSGHVLRGVPARPNSGQASVIASSTKEAVLRRPANKCNQCELATIHIGNMRMHMKSPQCSNLPQPQALPQASRILCSRITVSLHPSMKAAYEDAHEKTQRKDSKRERGRDSTRCPKFGLPTHSSSMGQASLPQVSGRLCTGISRIILFR